MELETLIGQTAIPEAEAPVKTLRAFVAQYGQSLNGVRRALARRDLAVPVDYFDPDLGGMNTLSLCRALVAEGRLAEHDGDMAHAARSYLNCVQLGQARSRGGLALDLIMGIAGEGIGTSRLAKLHHNLSSSDCRRLAESLSALEAAREPVELVLIRERAWAHYALGWRGRLDALIDDVTGEWREYEASIETAYLRNRAFIQLLICDLGVRTFQLQNGKLPRELSELVPDYRPSLPADPFSGASLVYRLRGDGYILYSIGPNRQDDGGRPDFDDGDIVLGMLNVFDTPASSPTGP